MNALFLGVLVCMVAVVAACLYLNRWPHREKPRIQVPPAMTACTTLTTLKTHPPSTMSNPRGPPPPPATRGGDCCQVTVRPLGGGGGWGGGHHSQRTTYQRILCRIHGRSVACCRSPQGLAFPLTCIDADDAMRIMQISKSLHALHPFISLPPALCGTDILHNSALREHFQRSAECNGSEQRRCT